jgi:hypothetical protein
MSGGCAGSLTGGHDAGVDAIHIGDVFDGEFTTTIVHMTFVVG